MASDDEKRPLLAEKKSHDSSHDSSIAMKPTSNFFVRVIQPCCAEFVGTAMFVFIGTMTQQNELLLAMAIGSGLAMAMLVYSFGQISGGHFNPAVTVGVLLSGGISVPLALAYMLVQLLGGLLGAAFTRGILSIEGEVTFLTSPPNTSVYYQISGGTNMLHSNANYSAGAGVGILNEALFTYLLVTVYLLVAVDTKTKSPMAGLAIGLAITVGMISGGSITEGAMNPVRAIAPAIVISDLKPEVWADHHVYWVGSLRGAVMAALIYRLIFAFEDRRLFFKN